MGDTPRQSVGRPRGFDVEAALEQAMRLFWEKGYEGASLSDLTRVMGIAKPSLYAAFGSKEELFARVLDRYAAGPGSYATDALGAPTAKEVAERMLRGVARTTTTPQGFGGCLTVQGALASSEAAMSAHELLARWRCGVTTLLEDRFRRAVDEGDLPPGADPARWARYLAAVGFGIAVQAASGVTRAELDEVVETALEGWPAG